MSTARGETESLQVSPPIKERNAEERRDIMKTIARLGSIAATFMLLSMIVAAAPRGQQAKTYFTIAGTVLEVDQKERTLLVADRQSEKLYLIEIPDGTTFKITFGNAMLMDKPGLADVNARERIEIRCFRGDRDHLARLDDGRTVIRVLASK